MPSAEIPIHSLPQEVLDAVAELLCDYPDLVSLSLSTKTLRLAAARFMFQTLRIGLFSVPQPVFDRVCDPSHPIVKHVRHLRFLAPPPDLPRLTPRQPKHLVNVVEDNMCRLLRAMPENKLLSIISDLPQGVSASFIKLVATRQRCLRTLKIVPHILVPAETFHGLELPLLENILSLPPLYRDEDLGLAQSYVDLDNIPFPHNPFAYSTSRQLAFAGKLLRGSTNIKNLVLDGGSNGAKTFDTDPNILNHWDGRIYADVLSSLPQPLQLVKLELSCLDQEHAGDVIVPTIAWDCLETLIIYMCTRADRLFDALAGADRCLVPRLKHLTYRNLQLWPSGGWGSQPPTEEETRTRERFLMACPKLETLGLYVMKCHHLWYGIEPHCSSLRRLGVTADWYGWPDLYHAIEWSSLLELCPELLSLALQVPDQRIDELLSHEYKEYLVAACAARKLEVLRIVSCPWHPQLGQALISLDSSVTMTDVEEESEKYMRLLPDFANAVFGVLDNAAAQQGRRSNVQVLAFGRQAYAAGRPENVAGPNDRNDRRLIRTPLPTMNFYRVDETGADGVSRWSKPRLATYAELEKTGLDVELLHYKTICCASWPGRYNKVNFEMKEPLVDG